MSRFDPRPTGVTLRILDVDTVNRRASEQLGDTYEVGHAPYAVADVGDDFLYVICHEGVGWQVHADNSLVLDLFHKAPGTIAIAPSYQARLSLADVRELTTDEEIDLAALVRRFGARLETNFRSWFRILTAKVGA